MDDGVAIDILDTSHDALLELLFRSYPYVAQDRAGKLGEEALDEVEPGAMLGREGKLEAAGRASSEPSFRLFGDVRGMIVEDQLDRGAGRIVAIKKLEELDELSAAMAVPDEGMDLTGEQINPGQEAERAVALILMITREGRVNAGRGRQIWRRVCDGLDTRFFVIGDDRHRLARLLRFGGLFQDLDLAINAQNLRHLLLEFGVATFQIVPTFGRLGVQWQPYLKGNVWWGSNGVDTVTFNGVGIPTGRNGGTTLEGGGGVTGKLTRYVSVYADASYLGSVSGETRNTLKGNAGLRVTW